MNHDWDSKTDQLDTHCSVLPSGLSILIMFCYEILIAHKCRILQIMAF